MEEGVSLFKIFFPTFNLVCGGSSHQLRTYLTLFNASFMHCSFKARSDTETEVCLLNTKTSKNIDCLSHLVCFISTVNGRSNKKRKEKKKLTLGRLALVAGT